MVHERRKPLISLAARKLSTPWVAGSNPAGIAIIFNGLGDVVGRRPCCRMLQLFPSCFNDLQRRTQAPCDMDATPGPHKTRTAYDDCQPEHLRRDDCGLDLLHGLAVSIFVLV
jgi:hypothetical protein